MSEPTVESIKEYTVEGMMCSKCTQHVNTIVNEYDGVLRCNVQLSAPQLTIEYSPQLSEEDLEESESSILERLNAEGYITQPL